MNQVSLILLEFVDVLNLDWLTYLLVLIIYLVKYISGCVYLSEYFSAKLLTLLNGQGVGAVFETQLTSYVVGKLLVLF